MTETKDKAAEAMHAPLEGVRVLDLTVALAGPLCTLLLGGLGAEVIKVEAPGGGDIARTNPPFVGPNGIHYGAMNPEEVSVSILNRARNKKSVTIDLKSEEGRVLFYRLAEKSDVVVENFSEGTADRLCVGYENLIQYKPDIVYASLSGLGDPNPYPGLKAMDIIIQAMSGIMEVTGFPDGPPTRVGIPIGDMTAPLFATSGILSALLYRNKTGIGQHIKVSLLDCLATLVAEEHFDLFAAAGFPMRSGNYHDRLAPFGVYPASDGYVAIAAPTDAWMNGVFKAIGQPELMSDPRFASRGPRAQNAKELNGLIEAWTSRHTTEEIVRNFFEKHRVPAVKVRRPEEVLADPRLRESGAVVPLQHPKQGEIGALGMGVPIHFSSCKSGYDQPAPEIGQHTDEILHSILDLGDGELAELRKKSII